ncbi:hypothetical protein [Halomonas campaniensis]|uniref:Uncharacterized protein n=1 Tax=Halomonas campaniensis TaxID=213554 RepID=A0A246RZZ8_9GAMM|nr:hypothetical protein [Halomonas campaniensis]OWV29728.1 hypothetical protein JI62_10770 [Halomonas campaniensis]
MGDLYISSAEREALKNLDSDELDIAIRECVHSVTLSQLYGFNLESCGLYVSNKLRDFQKSVDAHSRAKSSKKRDETDESMRRAADDLTHAVQQMQQRMEEEEKDNLLFQVDDHIFQPFHYGDRLEVRLGYQWRKNTADNWTYGSITFLYTPDLSPDYSFPLPKRKPSAAKLAQERQEKLRREWEHLKLLSLHSLRNFFREGGIGSDIPKTYQVTLDTYGRGLNNFSADFWR